MSFILRCGCFKKETSPQRQKEEKEPQPIDYTKLVNRNTSYIVADFRFVNPYDYYADEELVMSGTPMDMQDEFRKLKENTQAYLSERYPKHKLYKIKSMHVYHAPDANLGSPLVASPHLSSVDAGPALPPRPVYNAPSLHSAPIPSSPLSDAQLAEAALYNIPPLPSAPVPTDPLPEVPSASVLTAPNVPENSEVDQHP